MKPKLFIKAAAIKLESGRVVIGRDWMDVSSNLHKEMFGKARFFKWKDKIPPYFYAKMKRGIPGFITSEGKFVRRDEAAKIAFKAGQIKRMKKNLRPEDLL